MSLKNTSLATRLTIMSLSMMLFLGGINAVQFQGVIGEVRDSQKHEVVARQESIEHNIASQFYERYGDAQAFTYNQVFQMSDHKLMVKMLNDYVVAYGIYYLVMVVNLKGDLIAVNNRSASGNDLDVKPLYGKNFSSESWFSETVKGNFTVGKENGLSGTLVTLPTHIELLKTAYGHAKWANTFSAQIKNKSGQVVGVLTNVADMRWAGDELKAGYEAEKAFGHTGLELSLLGSDGGILWQVGSQSYEAQGTYAPKSSEFEKPFEANVEAPYFKDLLAGNAGAVRLESAVSSSASRIPTFLSYSSIKHGKFISDLGWRVVLKVSEAQLLGHTEAEARDFYLALCLSLVLTCCIVVWYTRRVGQAMADSAKALEKAVVETQTMGEELNAASTDLASSSSEQAAAVQESVSALNEMTSMLNQTSQGAKRSQESAKEVSEKSKTGMATVDKMVQSMTSISEASRNLESIAQAIHQIQTKTGLINDIVFKTQLLSFNASIEAARAGQYGKGFAVVAEEVGNLAQMSGNAAHEIETLVDNSQKQVDSTLQMIKGRVGDGQVVSDEVAKVFKDIAQAIQSINSQIGSIAEASQQQDIGIQQTQKAMSQIDVASQKNSGAATQTLNSAKSLSHQGERLGEVLRNLKKIVLGKVDHQGFRHGSSMGSSIEHSNDGAGGKVGDVAPLHSKVTADHDSFKRAS